MGVPHGPLQLEAMYKEWITNAEKSLVEAFAITPKEAHKFCGRAEGMQLRTVTLSSVAQSKGEDQGPGIVQSAWRAVRKLAVDTAQASRAFWTGQGAIQQLVKGQGRLTKFDNAIVKSSLAGAGFNLEWLADQLCCLEVGDFNPKQVYGALKGFHDEVKAGFAVARRLGN